MPDKFALEQEREIQRRAINDLEGQIKAVRDYITTQERNLRNAAETVRQITERGLADARSDLSLKEIRLQQLRQDLATTEQTLSRIVAIDRKQQDIQTLERERDRVAQLLDRARDELQRLNDEYHGMARPPVSPTYALVFAGGQRIVLPTDKPELLIGCADPAVFPDVDLTPFGGTTSGVSRRHALLRFNGNGWTITDLSSTNGTYVNTIKLQPNAPTPLSDQAKLRLGGIDATFTRA